MDNEYILYISNTGKRQLNRHSTEFLPNKWLQKPSKTCNSLSKRGNVQEMVRDYYQRSLMENIWHCNIVFTMKVTMVNLK